MSRAGYPQERCEKVEMILDSGSAVLACPESVGEVFGFAAPSSEFKFVTADGRACVQDPGLRKLEAVTEVGTPVNMNMRVVAVHSALVSAGDVTDKGHVVVSSKFGSLVAHDPNGQIHQTAYRAASCDSGCARRTTYISSLSGIVEHTNGQRKQDQASVQWRYQRHRQQHPHQQQCKEHHSQNRWEHHRRRQQEDGSWKEPKWGFYDRS